MWKTLLATENGSHSSLANLASVADGADIEILISGHVFEAKSISKIVHHTFVWIRSQSELQTPITAFSLVAKDRLSFGKMKKEEADAPLA